MHEGSKGLRSFFYFFRNASTSTDIQILALIIIEKSQVNAISSLVTLVTHVKSLSVFLIFRIVLGTVAIVTVLKLLALANSFKISPGSIVIDIVLSFISTSSTTAALVLGVLVSIFLRLLFLLSPLSGTVGGTSLTVNNLQESSLVIVLGLRSIGLDNIVLSISIVVGISISIGVVIIISFIALHFFTDLAVLRVLFVEHGTHVLDELTYFNSIYTTNLSLGVDHVDNNIVLDFNQVTIVLVFLCLVSIFIGICVTIVVFLRVDRNTGAELHAVRAVKCKSVLVSVSVSISGSFVELTGSLEEGMVINLV